MAYEFDRYINGTLMAEGVTIENAPTMERAFTKAATLASRGKYGEVPVLVLRTTHIADDRLPTRDEVRHAAKTLLRCNGADLDAWGADDLLDDSPHDALKALAASGGPANV